MDNRSQRSEEEILADLLSGTETDGTLEERRKVKRRDIRVPVQFIPISPAGPNDAAALVGETRNVSTTGIALVLSDPPLSPRWAVRLHLGGKSVLLEVDVRDIARLDEGGFYLACQFVRRTDE
jgi:hypothetical protein